MPNFSRREFIRLSALTGASLYLGFRPWELLAAPNSVDDSPIGRVEGIFPSLDFNGDDVRRPHQLLWDVEGYVRSKGGRPLQATAASVVVVGGGMAGLLSAYFLRDQKPLLLEQAQRFGGNSQGEVFGGATYSTGAAYITVPETGGAIDRMFRELGLDKQLRLEPESEARVLSPVREKFRRP